jgi:hypothetical protein
VRARISNRAPSLVSTLGWVLVLCGCAVEDGGIPEGKLARVGHEVLGPEDLAGVQSQLGSYAQLRFRGAEGQPALLQALIAAELLAQEADKHGLGEDPRVQWAVYEEVATLWLNAELERRVPRQSVASDTDALRRWYDAHRTVITTPERRRARGVMFRDYDAAEAAQELLAIGAVQLAWLGDVVTTEPQARDDEEHPGFHPILFDPGLSPGDRLSAPVLVGQAVLVGELDAILPPEVPPLDDPAVHERAVQSVRAPLLARAREALLAELAERFPETPP